MSFRWNSHPNSAGYCGYVYSTGGTAGQGQHGSMSKHELRNILFACGPSFKRGVRLDNPSGNIDLAPTILRILGISTEARMDGRALEEALAGGPNPEDVEWSTELHNAERRVGGKVYRQQIKVSRIGDTTYVDEGNSTLGRR
jgi:arylsulfatase A-like enzyme